MNYADVLYSRSQIEKAGKTIAKYNYDSDEYARILPIVDNWRASHAYPLDIITNIINKTVSNNEDIHVVQRLKRLDSIIGKLQRSKNTGLYRMQDLGGCRVIVPDISNLYCTVDAIKENLENAGHFILREVDYIRKPRDISGYRSYHIVVQYVDDKQTHYNGMSIEIQVRTKLEHKWATAVEIMDSTTNETLKVGTGKKEYMYFFKLVSALFSIDEKTTIVDGVPGTKKELVEEIYKVDSKEQIRQKLSAYNSAIKFSGSYPKDQEYYLLITDMRKGVISTIPYNQDEISEATLEYQRIEKTKHSNSLDVVLVAAKSFDVIRECYPNYFMETLSFLNKINGLCSEFPEKASIPFSTKDKGRKFGDFFFARKYKANKPYGVNLDLDGIGVTEGSIYSCPAWAISLDDAYLRYSGIKYGDSDLSNKYEYNHNQVEGTGIIVLSTGACFYVDDEKWEFISEAPSVVVQCKSGIDKRWLLFLLGWIKSNICTWDLTANRHVNSLYRRSIFSDFDLPNPDDYMFTTVCDKVSFVLDKEKSFVSFYNDNFRNEYQKVLEFVDKHNNETLNILSDLEDIFAKYYNINDPERKTISSELQMNGYFVYDTKEN